MRVPDNINKKEEDLKELQTYEAVRRLNILEIECELMPTVTNEFENEGTVYYSEYVNKDTKGVLYWVNNKEEFVNTIKEFEEQYNTIVYHVILTPTEFGDMLTLLYVSPHKEEWEKDKEELHEKLPCAYCINGDCSEFGGIEIAGTNGGIIRVN